MEHMMKEISLLIRSNSVVGGERSAIVVVGGTLIIRRSSVVLPVILIQEHNQIVNSNHDAVNNMIIPLSELQVVRELCEHSQEMHNSVLLRWTESTILQGGRVCDVDSLLHSSLFDKVIVLWPLELIEQLVAGTQSDIKIVDESTRGANQSQIRDFYISFLVFDEQIIDRSHLLITDRNGFDVVLDDLIN